MSKFFGWGENYGPIDGWEDSLGKGRIYLSLPWRGYGVTTSFFSYSSQWQRGTPWSKWGDLGWPWGWVRRIKYGVLWPDDTNPLTDYFPFLSSGMFPDPGDSPSSAERAMWWASGGLGKSF